MQIRPALFAGSWYPASAGECEAKIKTFIRGVEPEASPGPLFGGIVPHAGWYYSGRIACQVIQRLTGGKAPDLFLLFGMHLHPRSANQIMTEGGWETPFGPLPIETRLAEALTGQFRFTIETAARHTQDNTIELQLPFIKYFFPEARILPLGLPPAAASITIGRAAAAAARDLGLAVQVLGSTDLTHYGPNYGFSPRGLGPDAVAWVRDENDRGLIEAVQAMDPAKVIAEGLNRHNACCSGAAAAALAAAAELGATSAATVAYATSHDKSPGESFVGYVGMVFR